MKAKEQKSIKTSYDRLKETLVQGHANEKSHSLRSVVPNDQSTLASQYKDQVKIIVIGPYVHIDVILVDENVRFKGKGIGVGLGFVPPLTLSGKLTTYDLQALVTNTHYFTLVHTSIIAGVTRVSFRDSNNTEIGSSTSPSALGVGAIGVKNGHGYWKT